MFFTRPRYQVSVCSAIGPLVLCSTHPIDFKIASNEHMHNIVEEFEFRPDRTTDYGDSCN